MRKLTLTDVEKLRLVLSVYQDGSGQLARPDGSTLPGWRNFERSVSLIFEGLAQESKAIFDVLVPTGGQSYYGISCKMRRELKRNPAEQSVVPLELSNAARHFWTAIKLHPELNERNYKKHPDLVGKAIISLVNQWHENASDQMGVYIDLASSFYLVLLWNKQGVYQLFQFPHQLPDPRNLNWRFPLTKSGQMGNHLRGEDSRGKVFEWYGESGGQLKYYPRVQDAVWKSRPFRLEPLPPESPHGVLARVEAYFPEQWQKVSQATP